MNAKQVMLRIVTVVLAVGVALVAAELLLRKIGFEYDLYVTKVQFGFPDPIAMTERGYQPDRHMLWVPNTYPQKVATWVGKSPSIVFMGCSCTELGTYDRCFKDIVDREHPGSAFQYVNMGISGWSSYQGLQQLKRDVVRMHPRAITIYYGWNDHWKNFGIEDKDIAKFMKHSPTTMKLSRLRLVQLLNSVYVRHFVQKGRAPRARVSLEDFGANLTEIVRMARAQGIVPILLTAPSGHVQGQEPQYLAKRWLTDLRQLVPVHREYIEAVRQVARTENVTLVDLAQDFDSLPRDFVTNECFNADGIHPKPRGDQIIAQSLYRDLEKAKLLDALIQPAADQPAVTNRVAGNLP